MNILTMLTLLVFPLLTYAQQQNCLQQHILEAIKINTQRLPTYSNLSQGKSVKVSKRLIQLEKLTLKLSGAHLNKLIATHQERGIPVLCEDLQPMSSIPEISTTNIPEYAYNDFKHLKLAPLFRKITHATRQEKYHKITKITKQAIEQLPPYYDCMTKHVLETIYSLAKHAPKNLQLSKIRHQRSTKYLINKLIKAQLLLLAPVIKLDRLAAPLQERGITILCQDVPASPYFKATNKKYLDSIKYKPKFEGWYMRLTDPSGDRSIALVGASFIQSKGNTLPNRLMPGYLAVLINDNKTGKTKSFEVFPKDTTYTSNGQPSYGTHNLNSRSTFFWESKKFGIIANDKIAIEIPGVLSLYANMESPIPWEQRRDRLGPEGVILHFPFVPVHWFVHSLGSSTSYELNLLENGMQWTGHAFTHIEKNWGKSFPTAWIWSQATGPQNKTHFALAGGAVKIGPLKPFTSWLIGIRGKVVNWDFRKSRISTTFKTVIDACKGVFKLTAKDSKHLVEINAYAPVASFASVSIPTKRGFRKNGGIESFNATVNIKAYRRTLIRNKLVEVLHFKHAALEFGANYQCNQ